MIMKRLKLLAALVGISLGAAAFAAEPGLCKSMCAGEKRECRANAQSLTELDRDVLITPESKNPFDRANNQGQVTPVATQARERADDYRRGSERKGQCDTAYLRCTRACDASGHTDTDSVVVRRRQAQPAVNAGAAGQ
jgi:hypothetical protein